jgi:hypothetical protein
VSLSINCQRLERQKRVRSIIGKEVDIGERHGKDKLTHCEERVANSFVTDQLTLTKLGSHYRYVPYYEQWFFQKRLGETDVQRAMVLRERTWRNGHDARL